LIPILGLIQAGGWHKMMATIQQNVKAIHPSVANADFTSLWRNLATFDNPMGIDWFGMVFGLGLAVSFGYWCTDFLQVQRVIVAKDLRSAQNGTVIGAVLKMLVPLIVTIPGLLGLAVLLNSDGSPMVLVAENDVRANITHHTYNDVLPLLMGKYLGPGLLGLGVTAMIAGFMSGMAGNISAFATVWTYDVYRPLIRRNASDRHYLTMGRWASLLGVLISIGTAYALFYFSNILEFLQVLIFFFIVPLFGVVILGMLWKRCTPAGGFWGFLSAIVLSMCMWAYVHTFPDGYRPQPQVILGQGAVVTLEDNEQAGLVKVIVQSGTVDTTNVPIAVEAGKEPITGGALVIKDAEASLPSTIKIEGGKTVPVRVLAPEVVLSHTKEHAKFANDGLAVVLKPGVRVQAADVCQHFNPAQFNPVHAKLIARCEKAKPMAVNMYSAFWTLMVCLLVAIGVSLFTTPKPDAELTNLVMGLTPLPDEGPCPWHRRPALWATAVLITLVAINIIFW
jgi:solute:Na+ symporter, SSS family